VHHVGILYDQIMMHGQRNIKFLTANYLVFNNNSSLNKHNSRKETLNEKKNYITPATE